MTNFSYELFKITENSIVDNQYLKYRLEDILQNHEFSRFKQFFSSAELIISPNSELLKKGFRYEINKIYSDKSYLIFNYILLNGKSINNFDDGIVGTTGSFNKLNVNELTGSTGSFNYILLLFI